MARLRSTVDAKGRVVIPVRHRQHYSGPLVVTMSLEKGYLSCYRAEDFEFIRDQIIGISATDSHIRRLRYTFVGEALDVKPDAQGRISVSDELWSLIGVKPGDEIYLTDLHTRLDLCSTKRFHDELIDILDVDKIDASHHDIKGF